MATLPAMAAAAAGIGAFAGAAGLLLSYHAELPSGPCIVLVCGAVYIVSVLAGAREGVLVRRWRRSMHFTG